MFEPFSIAAIVPRPLLQDHFSKTIVPSMSKRFGRATNLLLLLLGSTLAWSGDADELFRLGIINERLDRPSLSLEQYGAF